MPILPHNLQIHGLPEISNWLPNMCRVMRGKCFLSCSYIGHIFFSPGKVHHPPCHSLSLIYVTIAIVNDKMFFYNYCTDNSASDITSKHVWNFAFVHRFLIYEMTFRPMSCISGMALERKSFTVIKLHCFNKESSKPGLLEDMQENSSLQCVI